MLKLELFSQGIMINENSSSCMQKEEDRKSLMQRARLTSGLDIVPEREVLVNAPVSGAAASCAVAQGTDGFSLQGRAQGSTVDIVYIYPQNKARGRSKIRPRQRVRQMRVGKQAPGSTWVEAAP